VQQQVQQPERLLPIARNRYGPHQQLICASQALTGIDDNIGTEGRLRALYRAGMIA